ncbi:histidine kinase [Denitrovibrio acetiphilus DSM 12809]|uniref:histidine kinase n=1 Tax=Denitrovibrio acetiphilus (strain DSM 12809 / NBRC 114555 / N2460) TaxID=522772 RepID=D4H5P3_DENA2|nr:ATP-binding protein [Denitrovibrio acetiphilus]ADD69484.1 histidine kinase [Denitrovibrio acetiphilus DSM 12809]
MNENDRLGFLEARVDFLLQEKTESIKALENVLEVDDLAVSLNKLESTDIIIERAFKKISKLVRVKSAGFMLVDESNGFFTPAAFFPEECRDSIVSETDKLIMDNTFALAVKANRSVTVRSKVLDGVLLVHALSTVSRTRGMFICLLDVNKEDVPDAVFSLITIVMNNTAHLLESFELYNRNKMANELLSKSVKRLEQSEIYLKSFNEKLEAEVESRTRELTATNSLLENEISERKKIEKLLIQQKDALANLNQTLENRVAVETENRRRSEQVLHEQSKMAAMGQMLNAISHQWRQPLNSLGMIVQDLMDEFEEKGISKEYLTESVEKAVKLILHMSNTIDDFCNLVRPDSNEREDFNLFETVKDVSVLVNESYSNSGIFIEPLLRGDNEETEQLIVHGEQGLFKQVLLNIFSNSKDAISERLANGKISRGLIRVEVESLDGTLKVFVTDNGGGIPVAVIDRVFEPYFTTKEESKGTGIGLYMSKVFIEEHMNGSIAASNTGDGALISICFNKN